MEICEICSLRYNKKHGIEKCPSCFGCDSQMTLQEIGEVMGITRERARQLEADGIRKIRSPSSEINTQLREYMKLDGDLQARMKEKKRKKYLT